MIQTEGLEEKLNQILNDPDSMAQILSMARSFGMGQESEPSASSPPPCGNPFPMDEGMLFQMMQIFQQMQQTDSKQEALLCALKPYLAPERREKLDQAMQLARFSRLAQLALGSGGLFGGKVG